MAIWCEYVSTFGGSLACVQFDHLRSSTVWLPKMGINNSIINKYISNRIVLGVAIITFSPWSNEKIISSVLAFEENHLTYGSFAFSPTRTLFCVAFQMFSTLIFGVCVCTESKENIWTIFFFIFSQNSATKTWDSLDFDYCAQRWRAHFSNTSSIWVFIQALQMRYLNGKIAFLFDIRTDGAALLYWKFLKGNSQKLWRNFLKRKSIRCVGLFSAVSSSLLLYILQRILQSIK